MNYPKKVKAYCPANWSHHRSGWPYCFSYIYHYFHDQNGIDFYTNSAISILTTKEHDKPWIAILHITESEKILEMNTSNSIWLKNLNLCRGLYVLSQKTKKYVEKFINKPIEVLKHPTDLNVLLFSWESFQNNKDKKIIFTGGWLRDIKPFYQLKTNYHKIILQCSVQDLSKEIDVMKFVTNEKYDQLLIENIIFNSIIDSSCNNTVVECIVRNTPIVINRLPALEEYLGKDYPLFYTSIEEAEYLIQNSLFKGYQYLVAKDKKDLSIDYFISSIAKSSIYQSLPNPSKISLL